MLLVLINLKNDSHICSVSPQGSVRVLPNNAVFSDGDSVNLTCLAEGGPGNRFRWYFNDSLLQNETAENLILVSNITALDNGGLYTCTVINDAGSGSDDTYVYVYPMITVSPNDKFLDYYDYYYYYYYDDPVTFSCEATAFPFPEYEWFSEERSLLFDDNVYGQYTSMLYIDYAYYHHGTYYCTATSNNVTVESERATLYGKCV